MTAAFSLLRALRGEYPQRSETVPCAEHGGWQRTVYLEHGAELGRYPKSCPACAAAQRRQLEAQAARQRDEALLALRLAAAQLPERFTHATFDNYDPAHNAQALERLRDYAARWPAQCGTGESLVLLGPVGTGKTHLAVALLRVVITRGGNARYCTVLELLREVRATWRNRAGRNEQELIDHFAGVQLLAIDEAGAQYGSDGERLVLFEILNKRYERLLPSLICGNASLEELERCLDARSVDRLRENGGRAVVLGGPSWRRGR